MYLAKPKIFAQFPNIIFGLSNKSDHQINDRFNYNMSKSIGDNEERVLNNRSQFFDSLGLSKNSVIIQKQTHSSIINIVNGFHENLVGDALITNKMNLGLAVSTADCTNIYVYDAKEKVIAAVHSGWEGTEKRILEKTIVKLIEEFNSNPSNIYAYLGPSISQGNYEVGIEFSTKFDNDYLLPRGRKLLLDLKRANIDMLLKQNVPGAQIEDSNICSYRDPNFHSYRRDKQNSGRAFGIIAIKGINEY